MANTEPPDPNAATRDHWVRTFAEAQAAAAPAQNAAKLEHLTTVLETFEADIAPRVAPLLQMVLDNPSTPDELKQLLGPLVDPQHFSESILLGIVVGSVIGPVLQAGLAPFINPLAQNAWSALPNNILTPAILAEAELKGVKLSVDPVNEAARSGYNAGRLNDLYNVAGQAIGIEQAILLWRRGDIGEAELERIVHYSNVRSDFLDDIKKLQFLPPGAGEVLSGAIKGHLDDATAQKYLANAGIDPAVNYAWLKATAGRPFSPDEMYTAMARGYTGTPTVDDALKQSDINPAYTAVLPYLQHHYPSLFQISRAITAGTMTPARATTILGYERYEAQDITAIVDSATKTTSSTIKELSMSQITRMYEAQLITQAEALTRLETLKFDAGTAELIIAYADASRAEALMNAAARKIGTLYIAHKMTKPAAAAALAQAGVPNAAQLQFFAFWDIERTANLHLPSEAQIVGAYRRGQLTPAETKARLLALGVQASDLAIFVADGWPPTKGPEGIAAAQLVVDA